MRFKSPDCSMSTDGSALSPEVSSQHPRRLPSWPCVHRLNHHLHCIPIRFSQLDSAGGTGLGLTTAIALAANGAKVYITGRRAEVLQQAVETATPKSGNGSVHAVQGDAATKEGIESESSTVDGESRGDSC